MTVFKRNKDICLTRLITNKDGSISTKEPCRIQVPERWMSIGLGVISDITSIYAFFPIIFQDNIYSVMNICAILDIIPSRTTLVTINDESYYEFHFDANTTIIKSNNLVKQDTITFNIIDEFIMKGKVPWWANVDDLCSLFDTADKHANSNIGKTPEAIEFLVSVISRKISDRSKSLRQTANSAEDFDINKIEFIALKSVLEALNSTLAKLSGAYFNDGVVSALVNPSTKTSKIERILRT